MERCAALPFGPSRSSPRFQCCFNQLPERCSHHPARPCFAAADPASAGSSSLTPGPRINSVACRLPSRMVRDLSNSRWDIPSALRLATQMEASGTGCAAEISFAPVNVCAGASRAVRYLVALYDWHARICSCACPHVINSAAGGRAQTAGAPIEIDLWVPPDLGCSRVSQVEIHRIRHRFLTGDTTNLLDLEVNGGIVAVGA